MWTTRPSLSINQIADWQEALQRVGNDGRITRKQIERRIEQLENKLKALPDGAKTNYLTLRLGVDRLLCRWGMSLEIRLPHQSGGNIKGIDRQISKSMDLYMKLNTCVNKNLIVRGNGFGTPVTNTMGELFTDYNDSLIPHN